VPELNKSVGSLSGFTFLEKIGRFPDASVLNPLTGHRRQDVVAV